MKRMIFNLYKQKGETPLECIQRFRKTLKKNQTSDKSQDKWTYLGRLDPMADGVLLVANGEDVSQAKREEFFGLDKEYEFTVLFGFATDTYDVLGKIMRVEKVDKEEISESVLMRLAKAYEGEREQKYPPYSSKMQQWNKIGDGDGEEEKEIPTKNIKIYKMDFLGLQTLSGKELLGRLLMDIGRVKGDFRQNETLVLWKELLSGYKGDPCDIYLGKFSAHVSSGTYIRGIVNDLGKTLGTGACALSITRTCVGDYKIGESVR